MKGSDIAFLLADIKDFGEVLAIDQLSLMRTGKMYVVNNKPHHHVGEHWVVVDKTKTTTFLFDSFGKAPQAYQLPTDWKYSKHKLQHPSANTCGVYCVYYITCKGNGESYRQMMNMFTTDKKRNDMLVCDWLANYWLE